MMRRKVGLILVLSLLCTLVGMANADRGAVQYGVYEDRASFDGAVKKNQSQAPQHMSEQAKEARRQLISRALGQAKSRTQLEQVAARFGLVIYQSNTVTISSNSNITSVDVWQPTTTFDSLTREMEFAGSVFWKNDHWRDIYDDAVCPCGGFPYPVGNNDSISLVFSRWSQSIDLRGYNTAGYDYNGKQIWWTGNVSSAEDLAAGKKAFTVLMPGQMLSNTTAGGLYNMWHTRIGVWFLYSSWPFASGTTDITTVYGHTFDRTGISSVDFTFGGGSDAKVNAGLTIHFTNTTQRWPAEGLPLKY